MASSSSSPLKLSLCAFLHSELLIHSLPSILRERSQVEPSEDRFNLTIISQENVFLQFMESTKPPVDCVILEMGDGLSPILQSLKKQSILVPAVILVEEDEGVNVSSTEGRLVSEDGQPSIPILFYHTAALQVPKTQLNQISHYIDEAITKFLNLSANERSLVAEPVPRALTALTVHRSLIQQQQRLAEKLKERLGYLGVYYKRNPDHFLRNMTLQERQELLEQLKAEYRKIILSYFSSPATLNDTIDNFVNLAFFSDVPVAQIVEIHMDLMDEFSKQLKLEGRSDEILLDYRLTLIDTIAHLCEMYRRSIPRET